MGLSLSQKKEVATSFEVNQIYNMDCIAGMSQIPDGAVDMILTDLPYGTTACKWDVLLPLDQLWTQFNRVLKPNGTAVFTACQPFTTTLISSNRKAFRYCWYWRKNNPTGFCFAKYQPMRCVEDIVVFYRHMPTYNPQGLRAVQNPKTEIKRAKADCVYRGLLKQHTQVYTNYPRNVLEFAGEHGLHPTQKPVALFEYLVRTYTDPGDVVLDCCMGSGTTAVACINTWRRFVGFEMDEKYCEIAEERIQNATKQ